MPHATRPLDWLAVVPRERRDCCATGRPCAKQPAGMHVAVANSRGGDGADLVGSTAAAQQQRRLMSRTTGAACAVAKAFATACQEGSDVNLKMFEDIFMQEDAYAFAHVRPRLPLKSLHICQSQPPCSPEARVCGPYGGKLPPAVYSLLCSLYAVLARARK